MKKLSEDESLLPPQGLNLAQTLVLGVALGFILILAARLFI